MKIINTVISSLVLNIINSWLKSSFVFTFLENELIVILVALMAINTTTISIVLSKLNEIPLKTDEDFENTTRALKRSVVEQVILLGMSIIVLMFRKSSLIIPYQSLLLFINDIILLSVFIYAIYILYDTANSVFILMDYK